jgi:hypothetical protein
MPDRAVKKRPRDINRRAAAIIDEATSEHGPEPRPDLEPEKPEKNPIVLEAGRCGGLKGGMARAA